MAVRAGIHLKGADLLKTDTTFPVPPWPELFRISSVIFRRAKRRRAGSSMLAVLLSRNL